MDYRLYIMQPVSNRLDNIANTISFFISISPLIIIYLLGNNKIILSPPHPTTLLAD